MERGARAVERRLHQVVCGEINCVSFHLLLTCDVQHHSPPYGTASSIRATLSSYHPVFIEGPASRNDDRDSPQVVAKHVVANLRRHWNNNNTKDDDDRVVELTVGEIRTKYDINSKKPIRPLLLIIQDDPYTPHGISAITRIVAKTLQIERCLVCLDENIDSNHALLANRENVRYEIQYSSLLDILNDEYNDDDSGTESNNNQSSVVNRLTNAIDDKIASRNVDRNKQGMDKLDTWYRKYALLQGELKFAIS